MDNRCNMLAKGVRYIFITACKRLTLQKARRVERRAKGVLGLEAYEAAADIFSVSSDYSHTGKLGKFLRWLMAK